VEAGSDWERVTGRLVPGWEARALEHRALVRRRGVESAGALLRLLLGSAVLGWGQRLVAGWAEAAGIASLSGEAVGKRLRQARAGLGVEVGLLVGLQRGRWLDGSGRAARVRLVDATTIRGPGKSGSEWRVHAVVDLEQGQVCGVDLTDPHGTESLLRSPLESGEIAVADRAHARRTDFGQVLAHGAELVVRIGWRNLPLETSAGEPLDLIAWLTTSVTAPTERPVMVQTPTGPYPLRVIAAPLPPDQAANARYRCRRAAQKKQRTVDNRSVLAAGFIMLVTTLDPTTWPLADVLTLYRCRWQIEVLFKRLKSIWRLDQLRARNADAAQAWILAGLLAALLANDVGRASRIPLDAWLDDGDHPLSRWRWTALWRDALLHTIRGPLDLLTLQRCLPALRRHLADSPRQRRLQAVDARHLVRSHPAHQQTLCA
jgi:hypothetical protein